MEFPGVLPKTIHFDIFGGVDVPETLITCWVVMALIIIFALIVRFVLMKKFQERPKGFQNVIELCVEACNKFSRSTLNGKASSLDAYIFSLATLLVFSGLAELFGVRAPGTDLSFTIGIALITFIFINAYGIYYKGVFGRIKSFGKPQPVIAPMKIMSDIALPISLSCRMFGNLFSGLIIMDMIYSLLSSFSLGFAAIGIPAVLSIYFNLFHVGMQAYVFLMLTLTFVHEAVE